jgi:hypothetical protein
MKIIITDDEFTSDQTTFTVPEEFAEIITWLCVEHGYQVMKWGKDGGYVHLGTEHALEGLDEHSWYWQRAIENYVGRVRLYGVTSHHGMQALLKIISSLISMPENLLRDNEIDHLPTPGVSSGN